MGVVGGIEQVLMVELTEDDGGEDVVPGHGVVRMLLCDLLVDLERGIEVEIVEVLHRLPDLGVEIEGVGVQRGCGLRGCSQGGEEDEEGQERDAERERRAARAEVPKRWGQSDKSSRLQSAGCQRR